MDVATKYCKLSFVTYRHNGLIDYGIVWQKYKKAIF